MSEPVTKRGSPETTLQRPGRLWTREEIGTVCEWLFEEARYKYFQFWGLRYLGKYATLEDVDDVLGDFFHQKLHEIIQKFDPARGQFLQLFLVSFRQFCARPRRKIENAQKSRVPIMSIARSGHKENHENNLEILMDRRVDIYANIEERQRWELLQRAIKVLPAQYSRIVVLHYWQGKSIREISQELGITETNAKVRLFRARQMLGGLIHGEGK